MQNTLETVLSIAKDAEASQRGDLLTGDEAYLTPYNTGLIFGDPDQLQQVVWNLLSDAIKFTPKGDRVQVRLARVNSYIELTVSDSGRGIVEGHGSTIQTSMTACPRQYY